MNRAGMLSVCALSLFVEACATPAPPPVVVKKKVVKELPRPQISADALKVLTQIDDIQETLHQLRNAVDLQQYAQQNAKRRQRQLYDDLDRRLRALERTQPRTGQGTTVPATVDASKVPAANEVTSQPVPTIPAQPLATTALPQQHQETLNTQTTSSENVVVQNTANTESVTKPVKVIPTLSPEQEAQAQTAYDDAFELLRKSRYQEAVVALGKVLQDYPASSVADDAQYWMAESYYVTREFEQALLGFRSVIEHYPGSPKAPEALLKIGYIQYEMGAYDRAHQSLQDVVVRFPESRVAIAAKARLEKMQREGR